jgi:hypothetical protein
MKKLHTFDFGNNVQVELLKAVLERDGIDYLVKNEHTFTAAGGIPFTECYPEVWIMNDGDFTRAKQVLNAWLQPSETPAAAWRCAHCHELIEGQFELCWNCEASRPDESSPA